ncbi:MAG: ATP-binding cassette domain-containing protein [Anaerolineaceae bacterium]|nr:ATP-binding cassette domain-containing protein [Anaerolineaceae bacterium]
MSRPKSGGRWYLAVDKAHEPQANMRWLLKFIARHKEAAIGSLVAGGIGGITSGIEPYLIGRIIDGISNHISLESLGHYALILLGFSVMTVVAFLGQRIWSGTVAYNVNYDIRQTLFDNLLTLEQRFYQTYPTGDLISRMYSDLDMIWRLLVIAFTRLGSASVTLVVTFVLLAVINVPLTVFVFVILTISTIIQMKVGSALTSVFEEVQEQAGVLSALVQDSVTGIQTIKTFGREAGVAQKYRQENNEFRRRWLYFKRRNEPVGMLPNMISEMTGAIVVIAGGILALQGTLTLGNFVQFLVYLALISNVLLQLGTIYQRYVQTDGALTRLTPLLRTAEIRTEENARPLSQPRGDICFENLSVQVEGKWLLRNINLSIPSGKVVAFVGPTGCGKTLLVSLLARVTDPTEGRVLIDGNDVRLLELNTLRRAIAYVPQSTFLFSQPVHANVRMGRETVAEEQLGEAISISRFKNDLPQLPHGLDTMVGEKGVMLSGGQKQRVAIARAIVRDPAIMVLDDALSSVDTHTAADILNDLRHVLRTRTSLIIAHRIATVKDADHVVVMDKGQIVEQGTHDSLVAMNGMYARMVERELKTEEDQLLANHH